MGSSASKITSKGVMVCNTSTIPDPSATSVFNRQAAVSHVPFVKSVSLTTSGTQIDAKSGENGLLLQNKDKYWNHEDKSRDYCKSRAKKSKYQRWQYKGKNYCTNSFQIPTSNRFSAFETDIDNVDAEYQIEEETSDCAAKPDNLRVKGKGK